MFGGYHGAGEVPLGFWCPGDNSGIPELYFRGSVGHFWSPEAHFGVHGKDFWAPGGILMHLMGLFLCQKDFGVPETHF